MHMSGGLFVSKSCGGMDCVCLAPDRNCEHGVAIVHYIL
jgi:hypothetical protein